MNTLLSVEQSIALIELGFEIKNFEFYDLGKVPVRDGRRIVQKLPHNKLGKEQTPLIDYAEMMKFLQDYSDKKYLDLCVEYTEGVWVVYLWCEEKKNCSFSSKSTDLLQALYDVMLDILKENVCTKRK